MKLIYTEFEAKQVETDIELPIYLYFQDVDTMTDEYIKYDGVKQVKITSDWSSNSVSILSYPPKMTKYVLQHNLITKEHFEEVLEEVLNNIKTNL